jgi:hypothetical protein
VLNLIGLMRFNGGQESRVFMNHISNCLFKIDNIINDGHGQYVFRISGQLSHKMGTLKPAKVRTLNSHNYIYTTLAMRLNIGFTLCVVMVMVMLMVTYIEL